MAREKFQAEIEELLDKLETVSARSDFVETYAHRLRINWDTIAIGMQNAVTARARKYDTEKLQGFRFFNNRGDWVDIAKKTYQNMQSAGTGIKRWSTLPKTVAGFNRATRSHVGVWEQEQDMNGVTLVVVRKSEAGMTQLSDGGFDSSYRRKVWANWIKLRKSEINKFLPVTNSAPGAQQYHGKKITDLGFDNNDFPVNQSPRAGSNLPTAHKMTLGKARLIELFEDIQNTSESNPGPLDEALGYIGKFATVESIDSVQRGILKGLKLDWKQERIPDQNGKVVETRVIDLSIDLLSVNNADTANDLKNLRKNAKELIDKQLGKLVKKSGISKADLQSSKTFRQAAGETAANEIMNGLVKGGKKSIKSIKRKKPSGIKLNQRGKAQPKKTSTATAVATGAALQVNKKPRVTGRGKSREKGKSKEINLGTLKAQINRRLPAEIRRNMGRPALINRTGRFSESAEVTAIRQSQKTLTADYTYQLRPYETFENTGNIEWPTGYNPKPLIAKSIRNLALSLTDQKFTLRRV